MCSLTESDIEYIKSKFKDCERLKDITSKLFYFIDHNSKINSENNPFSIESEDISDLRDEFDEITKLWCDQEDVKLVDIFKSMSIDEKGGGGGGGKRKINEDEENPPKKKKRLQMKDLDGEELHKYLKEKEISTPVKLIIPTEMDKDNLDNCLKILDKKIQTGNLSVTKDYAIILEKCENKFEEEKRKMKTKETFEEHLKKLELTIERRKRGRIIQVGKLLVEYPRIENI